MRITILQAKQRLHEKWMELTKDGVDEETMQALSIADTVFGNYDESLKADMVTMLEELKKEIIELPFPQREPEYMQGYSYCQMNILDYVIQEKINKLKGKEV